MADSKLRLLGVSVLCIKLAVVPLVFDPTMDMPFVVSKAALSHALAFVLAGICVGLLVRFGSNAMRISPLMAPVLAYLLIATAATAFAVDRDLAMFGTHARMLGLASILDGVALFFALPLLLRSRREVNALVATVLMASLVVLAYEGLQVFRRDPFVWSVDSGERPFSTLGQPTTLAAYLTPLAVAAIAIATLHGGLRPFLRLGLLAYSAVALAGVAATGTRSALIGVAASTVVMVLLVWRAHPSARVRLLSVVAAASGAVFVAGLLLATPLGARLATTIEAATGSDSDEAIVDRLEPSAASRAALYAIGLKMVRDRPVLGYGPDNFPVGVPAHREEQTQAFIRQSLPSSPHTWVLQVAVGTGLLGLASFISIQVVAFALSAQRPFRLAAVVAAVVLAAFLGTGLTSVSENGTEWILWFALGAIAAATAKPLGGAWQAKVQSLRSPRFSSNLRRNVAATAITIGVAIALSGLTAAQASRAAGASTQARLSGRRAEAVTLALQATRADPSRAQYWQTLGLAYVAGANWPDAGRAFLRASALAPYDVRFLGDLVRAELFVAGSGDAAARARAISHADVAVQVDPNNPQSYLTRAVAMQVTGSIPEAVRSVDRALYLDPGSVNDRLYATAIQVKVASGQTADAIRIGREGIGLLGESRASVGVRIELARALNSAGLKAEAIRELDVALAIIPHETNAELLRTQIQAGLGGGR